MPYLCKRTHKVKEDMFIVIVCMLLGIAAGYALRGKPVRFMPQLIITLIWLLLFLLGLEVGGNQQVVKQSGKIILQAFVIATAGTLGSVVAAKFLWKAIVKSDKKNKSNPINQQINESTN